MSEVISGMILIKDPYGIVNSVTNAKVVCYNCGFESPQAEAKATVVMNNDDELMNFSKGEEKELEEFVKKLKNKDIKAVIVNGTISDLALH